MNANRGYSKNNTWAILLIVFCALETLCFTYFKVLDCFKGYNNILYMVSGLALGVIGITLAFKPMPAKEINVRYKSVQVIAALGFFVFLVVLCVILGTDVFNRIPISHYIADMLPSIKLACERFIEGKDVYQHPINEPGMWPNTYIPYLPGMWMPYLPATILGLDIRWISLVAFLSISAFMLYWTVRYKMPYQWPFLFIVSILLFVLVKYYTWEDTLEDTGFFVMTQEAVPALFYTILFGALALNRQWLIAIALALCTLSRYSIAPFIPFYFLWLLLNKDYKGLVRILGIYTAVIAALFVIPFFIHRPMYFIDLSKGYINFEQTYWERNLQDATELTNRLGIIESIGFQPAILKQMKNIMAGSVLIWGIVWILAYYRKKAVVINRELYALAGFKIALVLFYNFLNMNYQYLYIVPTVVSYPLIWAAFRRIDLEENKTV